MNKPFGARASSSTPNLQRRRVWASATLVALLGATWSALAAGNPKISPSAIYPITEASYPRLYAAWGGSAVKKINDLMLPAAEKVAASNECARVELVEISQQRSTPGKEIVFFVDCSGGRRFYVSETELKTKEAAISQETKMKALSDSQADASCESAVKAKLNNPMTFKRKLGTSSVYRAPTTANVVVQFDFEAKNNLGGRLPQKARCVFTTKGLEEVTFSK